MNNQPNPNPKKPPTKKNIALGMARAGATEEEIKTVLKLSPRQARNLKRKLQIQRAKRHHSLRRKQTEIALAGSPSLLRFLGQTELQQSQNAPQSDPNLPNFDSHPDTGYPADDPRSIAMKNTTNLTAQSLLFIARFIAAALAQNPTLTWQDCLNELARAQNLPPQPWPQLLAQRKISPP